MNRISFQVRPLISLFVSYAVTLTSIVAPVFPSTDRSLVVNDRPTRSFREAPVVSGARAGNAASATLPITVAAGPKGRVPRLVKASDSSRPLTSTGHPKASSASLRSLPAAKVDLPVTKPVFAAATFVENRGQWDARVKFQFKSGGKTLWLTDTGIVYDNVRAKAAQDKAAEHTPIHIPRIPPSPPEQAAGATYDRLVFCEDFIGANGTPTVVPIDLQPGEYNYMTGSDPKGWHTGVHGYAGVIYRNVWDGIDIKLTRNGADIEQEFVVHPGIELNRVQIAYRGIEGLNAAEDGSLEVNTAFGKLRETPPRIYQEIAGRRVKVDGRFKLLEKTSYTFDVAAHKAEYAMIVDPTLLYSTFLGGSAGNNRYGANNEVVSGIAVDAAGNAYVTGYTASTDFPITPGAFQTSTQPGQSSFITKLNPTGSSLIYSTYFNGSSPQGPFPSSIALDANGNAYVAGWGAETGFPTTPNAYSQYCGLASWFLTVLNPTGSGLIYSTCFGSAYVNTGTSMAEVANGQVFIAGSTGYGSIPTTPNAYQTSNPGSRGDAAFAMVFDTTASGTASLLYSTLFGIPSGNSQAYGTGAYAIAADVYGNMYITGYAGDSLPVTPGAFQSSFATGVMCNPYGGAQWVCPDGFIAKFNPHASGAQSLIYSTYLGGPGNDAPQAITIDNSGNAYVTGYTYSHNFPVTQGAFQTSWPDSGNTYVAFVSKLNAGGSKLVYSTYLGGSQLDHEAVAGYGIAVDSFGNAYVAGETHSASFPVTPDAFQSTYVKQNGSTDYASAFLTKLNPTGSALIYSSYLGGGQDDVATGVALDQAGDAYIAGHTSSADLPVTAGAFQTVMDGTGDAFIAKFPLGAVQTLSIIEVTPLVGGNVGPTTGRIVGGGFHSGATVKLVGGTTVVGNPTVVGSEGRTIDVTFDLTGAPVGSYSLTVVNPDGKSVTLANSFTVQQGGGAQVSVSILTPKTVALGHGAVGFTVQLSNTGNSDAIGVVISLYGIPNDASLKPLFDISSIQPAKGQQPLDFSQYPFAPVVGQEQIPTLLIPLIAAGSNVVLPFSLAINSLPPPPPLVPTPPVVVPGTGSGPAINITAVFTTLQAFCNAGDGSCALSALKSVGLGAFGLDGCLLDLFCFNLNALLNQGQFIHGIGVFNFGEFILQELASVGVSCGSAVAAALLLPGTAEAIAAAVGLAITLIFANCVKIFDEGESQSDIAASGDPNDKEGIVGVGSLGWLRGNRPLFYSVYFSNEPTATAAAQVVDMTDVIDASADLSTLRLTGIVIGGFNVAVPQTFDPALGQNQASTTVDFRPAQSLIVDIAISLDPGSRMLSAQFASIDPTTGLPPTDPLVGVLPPGVEGSIAYSVKPATAVSTGTSVTNEATIVFDTNPPMTTQPWTNTIDNTPPMSQVASLPPTESTASFKVQWPGTDQGSGIQDYTIYASDNGGPFTAFLVNTASSSASFTGQAGHTYGFYSIARDLVGNLENPKTAAEATTQATQGAAPTFKLSPANLAFGSVVVGSTSASKTVKLTHKGPTLPLLTISSITISGDYSQTNDCPGNLGAGASCTITVTFTPNVAGSLNGVLSIYDSFANSPQVVPLTGTGLAAVSAAPDRLSLSSQVGSTSNPETVTVTNNTAADVSLSYSVSATFSAGPGSPSGCGSTLAATTNCTIAVTFSPGQPGTIYGSLVINSAFPTQVVDLTGTATGGIAPTLSFSPAKLSFKTPQLVGTTSAPLTVTVTNKGTSAVAISGLSGSTGFTATPSGTKPCNGSLAAGAKCTFQVTFTPPVTGATKGSISVANSGAINPLLYDVSGTGVDAVSFSPASLTFAAQAVGTTSAPKTVTLFNNQAVSLNIGSIVASGNYSAVAGGTSPCGSAVAANSSCTFVVSFSPTKTGMIKGVVTVTDDAPTSPQLIGLTGKGL